MVMAVRIFDGEPLPMAALTSPVTQGPASGFRVFASEKSTEPDRQTVSLGGVRGVLTTLEEAFGDSMASASVSVEINLGEGRLTATMNMSGAKADAKETMARCREELIKTLSSWTWIAGEGRVKGDAQSDWVLIADVKVGSDATATKICDALTERHILAFAVGSRGCGILAPRSKSKEARQVVTELIKRDLLEKEVTVWPDPGNPPHPLAASDGFQASMPSLFLSVAPRVERGSLVIDVSLLNRSGHPIRTSPLVPSRVEFACYRGSDAQAASLYQPHGPIYPILMKNLQLRDLVLISPREKIQARFRIATPSKKRPVYVVARIHQVIPDGRGGWFEFLISSKPTLATRK